MKASATQTEAAHRGGVSPSYSAASITAPLASSNGDSQLQQAAQSMGKPAQRTGPAATWEDAGFGVPVQCPPVYRH